MLHRYYFIGWTPTKPYLICQGVTFYVLWQILRWHPRCSYIAPIFAGQSLVPLRSTRTVSELGSLIYVLTTLAVSRHFAPWVSGNIIYRGCHCQCFERYPCYLLTFWDPTEPLRLGGRSWFHLKKVPLAQPTSWHSITMDVQLSDTFQDRQRVSYPSSRRAFITLMIWLCDPNGPDPGSYVNRLLQLSC